MDEVARKNDILETPNFQIGCSSSVGYYPNTRTSVTFYAAFNIVDVFSSKLNDTLNSNFDNDGVTMNIGVDANYYFTPRFRLNFNVDFRQTMLTSRRNDNYSFNEYDDVYWNMMMLSEYNNPKSKDELSSFDTDIENISSSFNVTLRYSLF